MQSQRMEQLLARVGCPWRMRGQQMNMTSLGSGRKIISPGPSRVCSSSGSSKASSLPPLPQFSPEKMPFYPHPSLCSLGKRRGCDITLDLWSL